MWQPRFTQWNKSEKRCALESLSANTEADELKLILSLTNSQQMAMPFFITPQSNTSTLKSYLQPPRRKGINEEHWINIKEAFISLLNWPHCSRPAVPPGSGCASSGPVVQSAGPCPGRSLSGCHTGPAERAAPFWGGTTWSYITVLYSTVSSPMSI